MFIVLLIWKIYNVVFIKAFKTKVCIITLFRFVSVIGSGKEALIMGETNLPWLNEPRVNFKFVVLLYKLVKIGLTTLCSQ